jgi:hypothetical protein
MENTLKTNVTMVSTDRNLFGVTIRQETKTSFLNLSDLQEAYTHARVLNGWSDKKLNHILDTKSNAERIYYLLEKQGIINTGITAFMEEYENEGYVKTLKKYGAYRTTGRGADKTVYCNAYLWVLLAMELNPELYATVIFWLTDKLILNRIEAGAFYKELSSAIYKWNPDYAVIAKWLNHIIFGKHETGVRNSATQEKLKELRDLEAKLAFAINMGYITSEESLVKELRKVYKTKYNKELVNL